MVAGSLLSRVIENDSASRKRQRQREDYLIRLGCDRARHSVV